jgi:hypothetical protein
MYFDIYIYVYVCICKYDIGEILAPGKKGRRSSIPFPGGMKDPEGRLLCMYMIYIGLIGIYIYI